MDIQQRFRQDHAPLARVTSSLPYVIWSSDLGVIKGALRKIQPAPFTTELQAECKAWGISLSSCFGCDLDEIAFSICRLVKEHPSYVLGVTLEPETDPALVTARLWRKKGR